MRETALPGIVPAMPKRAGSNIPGVNYLEGEWAVCRTCGEIVDWDDLRTDVRAVNFGGRQRQCKPCNAGDTRLRQRRYEENGAAYVHAERWAEVDRKVKAVLQVAIDAVAASGAAPGVEQAVYLEVAQLSGRLHNYVGRTDSLRRRHAQHTTRQVDGTRETYKRRKMHQIAVAHVDSEADAKIGETAAIAAVSEWCHGRNGYQNLNDIGAYKPAPSPDGRGR